MCGSKRLNQRISAGCTSFKLLGTESRPKLEVFPQIVLSFRRLHTFCLNRVSYKSIDTVALSEHLQELPPTLQVLKLVCHGAYQAFMNLYSEEDPPIYSRYPRGRSKLWNISKTFPTLRSLEIRTHGWETHDIDSTDFAALPDSLTELIAFGEVSLSDCELPKLFSSLPPAIETLGLPFEESHPDFEHLPKSITHLKGISTWHREHLAYLPPNIKTVENLRLHNFCPEDTRVLPHTLSRLTVVGVAVSQFEANGVHWCNSLPKGLTYLVGHTDSTPPLDKDLIAALPRTLTALDWYADISCPADPEADTTGLPFESAAVLTPPSVSVLRWPIALKALTLGPYEELDLPRLLSLLPNTLTSLSVTHRLVTYHSVPNLPPSITTLDWDARHEMSAQWIPTNLSPHLRTLIIHGGDSFKNLDKVPPTLTHLELLGVKMTAAKTAVFPPSLKVLKLFSITYDALKLIPRTLSELYAQTYIGTTSASAYTQLPSSIDFSYGTLQVQ